MESRRRRAAWLGPGLAASLAMVGLMLGLRVTTGTPSLPELVEDRVLALVPGELFSLALERLEHLGKPLLLVGLAGLQLAAGTAGAGLLLGWLWPRLPVRTPAGSIVLGAALGLACGAALAIGLTRPALQATGGPVGATGALQVGLSVVPLLTYGLVLGGLARPRPAPAAAVPAGRRRALELVIVGAGVVATLASLERLIEVGLVETDGAPQGASAPDPTASGPLGQPAPGSTVATSDGGLSPDPPPPPGAAPPRTPALALPEGVVARVTSTPDFYVVSKNFVDPVVQADGWSLELGGRVDHPLALSYAELLDLPAVEVERTLECISNPIGGPQISNGLWRGVRLSHLLDLVGARPEATELVFTAADNYLEHLPIEKARDPQTLLVHTLNAAPLGPKHGFPARVLTTGLYGMKNPKWVRTIELVDRLERGYWERRGWTPTAPIRTMARLDVPRVGHKATSQELVVGGVAFAGERGIQRVEVSLDQGQTWSVAEHETDRPPSVWVRWVARVVLPDHEAVQVMARAVDGRGDVQDATVRRSFPAGATGYHRVLVEWAEPADTPASS